MKETAFIRGEFVTFAYLEHHVVLTELLDELLAVAHVPAQICGGMGKGKRRGENEGRDADRSPGGAALPFCRAWKSFASIASLSWILFTEDIVACVSFHACDARAK